MASDVRSDHHAPHQPPLYAQHVARGAKLAVFGGWEMPLEYTGVVKEHTAVREAVGVFDVSHLGKVVLRGPGAAAFVNRCLTNDLGKIEPGKAQYTLCCDPETGGVVDDMIAYLYGEDHVFVVPNAANTSGVVDRLRAEAPDGVGIEDQHETHAILAVQGPRSDAVLDAVGLPTGHDYMSFVEVEHAGAPVVVCRTGYTGERGYELVVPNDSVAGLWEELLGAGEAEGIAACGLGARDTLRTEMGYPLHGQDITADITPNEARLGWAVGWKKEAFWGREPLMAEREMGPKRRLRGILAGGRGIPRPGMPVLLEGDVAVGEVTSGTFSPTLRKGVGMALLAADVTEDTEVWVDVRGRREAFTVTKPPFVTPGVRGG
jgi:aminomethyltransferase